MLILVDIFSLLVSVPYTLLKGNLYLLNRQINL
eukprot:UN21614